MIYDFLLCPKRNDPQTFKSSRYTIFLLCPKRNDPQTFKSSSCKTPFLQCICYWYDLLR